MDKLDYIFTDIEYNKLNNEYQNSIYNSSKECLKMLNWIIHKLNTNSFQLPLMLQNKILDNLYKSKQILSILNNQKLNSAPSLNFINNPFNLIYHLSTLSRILNSYPLKSAYQITYLKANEIVLDSIIEISNYFKNKNLKNFKYM